MATSEKQVIQLLSFMVQTEDNTMAFRPSLMESQLYKFMSAMQFCTEENSVPVEKQLGQHINECMTSNSNENIEVVGCFGKQEAVQAELVRRGWCTSSDFMDNEKEGIYAIVDSSSPRKVVLYTWQQNNSFQSDLLQQRATYALRFLTTLTSNIIVCLTLEDWNNVIAASNAMSDDDDDDFTQKLKIVNEDAVKECVSCEFVSKDQFDVHHWCKIPVCAEDVMTVELEKVPKIHLQNHSIGFTSDTAFAKWLSDEIQEFKVVFVNEIPKECISVVLQEWHLHPKQIYDAKMKALDIIIWQEAQKRAYSLINKPEPEPEHNIDLGPWTAQLHQYLFKKQQTFINQIEMEEPWRTRRQDIEQSRTDEAAKRAFDSAIAQRNSQLESADTIKIQFTSSWLNLTSRRYISFTTEHHVYETNVYLQGHSKVDLYLRDPFTIFPEANILYINYFSDKVIIVYLHMGRTCVHVWAVGSTRQTLSLKWFPKEALRCDFDPTSRILVLHESKTSIGLHAFNEGYTVLQKASSINLTMMQVHLPLKNLICFGGDNPGVLVIGADKKVQLYYRQLRQYGVVMDNFDKAEVVVKMKDGKYILFLSSVTAEIPATYDDDIADNFDGNDPEKEVIDQASLKESCVTSDADDKYSDEEVSQRRSQVRVLIQTLVPASGSILPKTTLLLSENWTLDGIIAESHGDFLVLYNTKTMQLVTYRMTIVVGKSNYQLKSICSGDDSTKKVSNMLECFFHVHDMFPIQAMLDEKSATNRKLYLHIGTESSDQKDALTKVLKSIMSKIEELKKPMAKLDLIRDLNVYDILNPPAMTWLESTISIWILNLVDLYLCRYVELKTTNS